LSAGTALTAESGRALPHSKTQGAKDVLGNDGHVVECGVAAPLFHSIARFNASTT